MPTGAHDPPNKIRLVLELYGLFFDELFGHVPEWPHSSSQPLYQARDMPPYHRMMVRVVLILLMPGAAGAELHEGQRQRGHQQHERAHVPPSFWRLSPHGHIL